MQKLPLLNIIITSYYLVYGIDPKGLTLMACFAVYNWYVLIYYEE